MYPFDEVVEDTRSRWQCGVLWIREPHWAHRVSRPIRNNQAVSAYPRPRPDDLRVLKLSYAILSMSVVRVTATVASAARLHRQREKLRVLSSFVAAVLVLRRGGHMLCLSSIANNAAKYSMAWSARLYCVNLQCSMHDGRLTT